MEMMRDDAYRSYPGPAAWRADELAADDWLSVLTPAHEAELESAVHSLPADYAHWIQLRREDVPLPTLGPLLDSVNQELEHGKGFAVLRGLNVSAEDVDYAYRVNWVLALNLGQVICQNANGEVIGAVQAQVTGEPTADTRGYISNAELRFHCDGGDVASLLCVRQAPEGGSNSLVSAVSVHNAMFEECPQHLSALYRGMPMYMRKEGDYLESSELPRQPLFMPQGEHLLCWSNLKLMELAYATAGRAMPEEERAALDAFEAIAERPEYKLSLKLQPGDLLLTHNFVCMHKRAGFVDDPDPAKSRLMLRLWYNIADGRANAVQSAEGRKGYFTQSPPVITATFGTPGISGS